MSRKTKKNSSVRHTRAIQLDRSKRPSTAPPDQAIEERLCELVHPATFAQIDFFHSLGLRARTLTLPVMVAFVMSLLWRSIGSVMEATRLLNNEGFLWESPIAVSQQALSERMRTLPSVLFERIFFELLPRLEERSRQRTRPQTPLMEAALTHFSAILAFDGSTLDALLGKVGLQREAEQHALAGRIAALLDLQTMLPRHLWYEADSQAHDGRFWPRILDQLEAGMLVLFDLGFVNYAIFDLLGERSISFITRLKKNAAFTVETVLSQDALIRDRVVILGSAGAQCSRRMRLVEVGYQGTWYRYLTNVLDPSILSPEQVASWYRSRWRIEDVYKVVKRLLGLAYFYGGSQNAVELQLWMTWVLYGVLVDLSDAVAEELGLRFDRISMEMVYRGLYHFTQAYHRGEASDPVKFLAEHAKLLGLIKRKRRKRDLTKSSEP